MTCNTDRGLVTERCAEIEVSDAVYQQMKAWAAIDGVSVDELADLALREYLDKHIGEFTNNA